MKQDKEKYCKRCWSKVNGGYIGHTDELKCSCPCHQEDRALTDAAGIGITDVGEPKETIEDWEKEFDEFYTLPENMIPGPQREKAIKSFIHTQKQLSYKEGQKNPQASNATEVMLKIRDEGMYEALNKLWTKNIRTSLIQELIGNLEIMELSGKKEGYEQALDSVLTLLKSKLAEK